MTVLPSMPDTQEQFALVFSLVFCAAFFMPFCHWLILNVTGRKKFLCKLIVVIAGAFILWTMLFLSLKGERTTYLSEWISGYALLGFFAVGYLEVMLNLYRGFSYTLIADISRYDPLTIETLLSTFGESIGIEGMFQRRLESLCKRKLIRIEGDRLYILNRGKLVERFMTLFQRILSLPKGG